MFFLLLFLCWPISAFCQWGEISSFELFALDSQGSGTSLGMLGPNSKVDLSQYNSFTIVANVQIFGNSEVGRVEFYVNSSLIRTENSFPYSIAGDNGDGTTYFQWVVSPNVYVINSIPYNQNNKKGIDRTIVLTVYDSTSMTSESTKISSTQLSIHSTSQQISTTGIIAESQQESFQQKSAQQRSISSSDFSQVTQVSIIPNDVVSIKSQKSVFQSTAFLVSIPIAGFLLIACGICVALLLIRRRNLLENQSQEIKYPQLQRTSYYSGDQIKLQRGNMPSYSPSNTVWKEISE